ncbi:MAG TPA: cyclase family protein [Chloroflexaceae bacterium]|nr:cyclase family protein [Chloroflexaceae bacterium]
MTGSPLTLTFDDPQRLPWVFDLEQPRTAAMPIHPAHLPGYSYVLHRRHQDNYGQDGPRSGASGMIVTMEHTGTHIDALCHQAEHLALCGGVPINATTQTPRGFTRHGVEEIGPIVGPGLLLDVAALRGVEALPPGYAITEADLEACCARQRVTIEAGDVVLVRTGNERFWDESERYLAGPGVHGDGSRWLARRGVRAVGADTMAWDVIGLPDEELGCTLPGHVILLAQHGIYIIENLRLAELAATEAWRFVFVCAPLKFVGATGSPVRPLAFVARQDEAGQEGATP